jgi:hypothetical protein
MTRPENRLSGIMREIESLKQQNAELLPALHHAKVVQRDPSAWDTVSSEPLNFQEDEACTATVEDGGIAKLALEMLPQAAADKSRCPVCGHGWDAHEFGVPRPYCPSRT